ncbi:tetratricopeptide (TPR) repeat protein [Sphingomonas sp. F9_3S_D5_B_2]
MSNFRIAPLGTCRIHTPLSRAVGRYPIDVDLRRNYGFVHTSDEALQQLRFMQGEKQFRPEVLPLVFRSEDRTALTEDWQPADLYIVEISSAKRITSGEDTVQINFVYRHFADFFASTERSRHFWNKLREGHRQDLVNFLEQHRSYHLMSQEDRDLLLSLSVEQQTFKAVKKDMAEIVERLGRDKVLFVTHINAVTPDGEQLPTRDRLIRWVKVASEQIEAEVFDPTGLMLEVGQEAALEKGGLDLTHYSPAFSDRVYSSIHQTYVVPRLGAQSQTAGDPRSRKILEIAARVENTIELGDFFAGSRELHAAIDEYPDAAELLRIRGVIRSRIGDYRGAMADLSHAVPGRAPSEAVRVALLEVATAVGDHERALKIAQDLVADDVESSSLYQRAAESAEKAGKIDLAINYAKQLYRRDRSDLSSALHALEMISTHADESEVQEWRAEILENIRASSTGALGLCFWALRHRDEELFAAGLELVAAADKAGTIDLMEDAFNEGMQRAMAASIPIAVGLGRVGPEFATRRNTLLDAALQSARLLYAEGLIAEAHALARSLADLHGVQSKQVPTGRLAGEARELLRDMTSQARENIRIAFDSGDMAAVIQAGEQAGAILEEDARSAVYIARALQSAGQIHEALELLQRVRGRAGETFLVRRWMGRLAVAAEDYATALETYGALRASGDPDLPKVQAEMDRFFQRVEPRALKKLSLFAAAEDYEEGLRLAAALNKHLGPRERTDRQVAKMFSGVRVRLKAIEEGDGDVDEREPLLRQMMALKPRDPSTIRRLALELMRQYRFAEAAELWQRLAQVDPTNDYAERNRDRCATLAQRRASASGFVMESAG